MHVYNTLKQMGEEKYQGSFQLLKVICTFLIISFHYVYHGKLNFDDAIINKILSDYIRMGGELGVNCFVLISGYFLVEKSFRINKVISYIIQAEFYYTICIAIALKVGAVDASLYKSFLNWILPIYLNKWWFTTAYFCLLLFFQYINKLIKALSKNEYQKLLFLLLLLYCILPTVFSIFYSEGDTEVFLYYNRLIWMIVMYIIGAYIRLYKVEPAMNFRNSLAAFSGLTVFLMAYITMANVGIFIYNESILIPDFFWRPNTIVMVLWSVSLFLVFCNLKIKNHRWLDTLAGGTLGVYMIHDGVLKRWWWDSVFKNSEHATSPFLLFTY